MDDLAIVDRFLDTFLRYIDSGFGLLRGEVAYLTATLVVIDMTLAGLFWAAGGEEVIARLLKKTLYVGAFAFLIGNFNHLSGLVFRSFARLGLVATGSALTEAQLLQPGRLAQAGVTAARPLFTQIEGLMGIPELLMQFHVAVVLLIAWLLVILSFFVLAVQVFVTLIEFKLTTLAGFVLVPFALWNKTAFLAERVLGNVVSSGVKVLVLAVIVGIGGGLFAEFRIPDGTPPSIDLALVLMLASLALLGLGIFGPGIATGLVSGAPQLGAGAAVGTALGAAGMGVAAGAVVASGASAVAAGTRMAPSAWRAITGGAAGTQAVSVSPSMLSPATGVPPARMQGGVSPPAPPGGAGLGTTSASGAEIDASSAGVPRWARRMQRRQRLVHGASTAVQAVRSGDHGGSGASPTLRDDSNA